MESMRSLNSSLPSSSSNARRKPQPPEQLLQAFKTAALSVTNLYKTAASEQAQLRAAGYQDALEDLLWFLDNKNIGLGSGEEQVRRWIAGRISSRPLPGSHIADSDEDAEEDKRARSSSPVLQRKSSREEALLRDMNSVKSSSPRPEHASRSAAILNTPTSKIRNDQSPPVADFTFRSPTSISTTPDSNTESPEVSLVSDGRGVGMGGVHVPYNSSVRVGVVPRLSRSIRPGGHPHRSQVRSAGSPSSLGPGGGTKRRLPFGEYFDLGLSKDGSGGPKRGKYL